MIKVIFMHLKFTRWTKIEIVDFEFYGSGTTFVIVSVNHRVYLIVYPLEFMLTYIRANVIEMSLATFIDSFTYYINASKQK